jgi:hypothetical protein
MKKLNFENIKNVLSRDEMKKIMAGSGNCQERGQKCNSANHLNCCSELTCAEFVCKIATL